jgi:predicted RNase H-like HicB family nuclease
MAKSRWTRPLPKPRRKSIADSPKPGRETEDKCWLERRFTTHHRGEAPALFHAAKRLRFRRMSEITFTVSPCEETGVLVASWDAPGGGGITTQGASVEELRGNIREALACHFEEGEAPRIIRLHFAGDVLLQGA